MAVEDTVEDAVVIEVEVRCPHDSFFLQIVSWGS